MPQLFSKLSAEGGAGTLASGVANDILALMNASLRAGRWEGTRNSPAFSSVLNFGNAPLGCFGDGKADLKSLANSIKTAILMFESRLIPSSVKVLAMVEQGMFDGSRSKFQWPVFCVEGVLAANNEPFVFRMRIGVLHGHACADI